MKPYYGWIFHSKINLRKESGDEHVNTEGRTDGIQIIHKIMGIVALLWPGVRRIPTEGNIHLRNIIILSKLYEKILEKEHLVSLLEIARNEDLLRGRTDDGPSLSLPLVDKIRT